MAIHFELCLIIKEKCITNQYTQACVCGPIFWLVNPDYATAEDLVNSRGGIEVLLQIVHNSTDAGVADTLMVRKEYAINYLNSLLESALISSRQ